MTANVWVHATGSSGRGRGGLLIERALGRRAPERGWSKTELAAMAEVSPNGGVDEHVEGLRRLGALEPVGSRWRPPVPRPAVTKALLSLLRELPRD